MNTKYLKFIGIIGIVILVCSLCAVSRAEAKLKAVSPPSEPSGGPAVEPEGLRSSCFFNDGNFPIDPGGPCRLIMLSDLESHYCNPGDTVEMNFTEAGCIQLASDLTGYSFQIQAPSGFSFDCNDYTVNSGQTNGISASGGNINRCKVEGATTGIQLSGTATAVNSTASHNNTGFRLGDSAVANRCLASNNTTLGFELSGNASATAPEGLYGLRPCESKNNGMLGFYLQGSSYVDNCTASNNGDPISGESKGLHLVGNSRIGENTLAEGSFYGFYFENGSATATADDASKVVARNNKIGFSLYNTSRLEYALAENNAIYGYELQGDSAYFKPSISNVTALNNNATPGTWGIYLAQFADALTGIKSDDNSKGIYVGFGATLGIANPEYFVKACYNNQEGIRVSGAVGEFPKGVLVGRVSTSQNVAGNGFVPQDITLLPCLDVISPNGGEAMVRDSTVPITWRYALDPHPIPFIPWAWNVRLQLTRAGQQCDSGGLNGIWPNGGSYNWLAQPCDGIGTEAEYKIRIIDEGNNFSDDSDGNFAFFGPTYVEGDVSGQIWTKQGSPYIVTDSINIGWPSSENPTLTIEPGVEVRVNDGKAISVYQGALRALGTYDEPIVFSANPRSRNRGEWGGIAFGEQLAETKLQYCFIENADEALHFSDSVEGTFLNNIVRHNTTGVISSRGSYHHYGNTLKLKNFIFYDNEYGVLWYVPFDPEGGGNLSLQNSIFFSNNVGIHDLVAGPPRVYEDWNVFYLNGTDLTWIYSGGNSLFDTYPMFKYIWVGEDERDDDFHLDSQSPARNSANPDWDEDGISWPDDPDDTDPDGTRRDRGVFYFQVVPDGGGPGKLKYILSEGGGGP